MTAVPPTESKRVYRLLPSLVDFCTLRLTDDALQQLARWCYQGSPHQPPSVFPATWVGEPRWRTTEFPSHYAEAPIISRGIADLLRDDLLSAGRLAPVQVTNPVDDTEYLLYVVHEVVDCVDTEQSSPEPINPTGELERTVLRPEAVPTKLPAFRIPQYPVAVHWNGWAADRLAELLGEDLERRLVWSDAPGAAPHHRPWGIWPGRTSGDAARSESMTRLGGNAAPSDSGWDGCPCRRPGQREQPVQDTAFLRHMRATAERLLTETPEADRPEIYVLT